MIRVIRLAVTAALAAVSFAGYAHQGLGRGIHAVGAIGMTVRDMDRSVAFYRGVLTFEKVSDTVVAGAQYERLEGVLEARVRIVRLRLGNEMIELTQYLTPAGRSIPGDFRSEDRTFQHVAIVVSDMDRAFAVVRHNVSFVSTGPQLLPEWNPNAGGISAFYFKDPDGHILELIHFPPGKGQAKWQTDGGKLFLGIDHTAIVVSSTDQSLAFYRDDLGFNVGGHSLNYGVEQEHLANVAGARVRITGLRAASGPGVEFLEYLSPLDGRPAPSDIRSNDLIHWQTTVVTSNADSAAQALRANGVSLVSRSVVKVDAGALGFAKGFLIRDPDGHVLEVVEP
jgi:catechol 2,3-dioxygenase-like lactoylglutathione lyase family enzyme